MRRFVIDTEVEAEFVAHIGAFLGAAGDADHLCPLRLGELADHAADRPPNELKYVSVLAAAYPTTLIAAPGAGKRIRLFYLQAYALVNTANYYVVCTVNSANVYAILSEVPAGQTLAPAVFPLTGLACDANTAVNIGGNAGTAGATAGYTIETI